MLSFHRRRQQASSDRGARRQQPARPRHQSDLQPLHRLHRRGPALVPPLQPSHAWSLRQRAPRSQHPQPALYLWSVRIHGPSVADRKMPAVPRSASRQYRDVQREMLHILRPAASVLQGGARVLPGQGWDPRGREQPCAARVHQLGALAKTPVSDLLSWGLCYYYVSTPADELNYFCLDWTTKPGI